jgi:NADH dehydrogenase [ubiquinone] 1 alpha subcomplex assembly factor 1
MARTNSMRYLRYPAVKVALVCWFGMVPLAWFADWMSFEGPRPVVGPWMLFVLMVGPLLFSAALSLAVVRLPAVDTTSLHPTLVAACGLVLCFSSGVKGADEPSVARAHSITEFDGTDGMDWQVVNDGVMGGLSEGKLTPNQAGTMTFSGMLSLENNGGFSTFRSGDLKLDLSRHLGLLLRVKGDGRTYQVRLATDAVFRGMEVSFAAEVATIKGEWVEVKVPFADFKGSFRGLDLPEERLDTSKVRRVSILIGDKKHAPFEVELDFVRTYGATASNG